MKLAVADHPIINHQLHELAVAIEELLRSGLTAASQSTRETMDVTFREASSLKLLRLAATLRAANEELGRFVGKQPDFNAPRLTFFLNRAWMLARGLQQALADGDSDTWDRLLWIPPSEPVAHVEVVTIGVSKKVAKGSFCAFEFRLRRVCSATSLPKRLTWSCIFPLKPDLTIPAEAFLQLPQKQKFKASAFLESKVLALTNVLIAADAWGGGRVTLTESSTVTAGNVFTEWEQFTLWTPGDFCRRIDEHEPSPFDLEVELQDEVVLRNWMISPRAQEEHDGTFTYPLTCNFNGERMQDAVRLDAIASSGSDGAALVKRLDELSKENSQSSPLFGLMHFDRCRCILQPQTLLNSTGPDMLTIETGKIDPAALLKTLKF